MSAAQHKPWPRCAPVNAGTHPRIRPANFTGRLLCVGHGAYGYGCTAVEAYEAWEASRRYILTTPHRNQPRYAKATGSAS